MTGDSEEGKEEIHGEKEGPWCHQAWGVGEGVMRPKCGARENRKHSQGQDLLLLQT